MLKTANPILNKALDGERISAEEALELFESAQLLDLAYVANEIRRKHHPDSEPATYVVQRNVNYAAGTALTQDSGGGLKTRRS